MLAPVPNRFRCPTRKWPALGVEKKQVEVNFEVGDSVKITDGYLDGFIGVVEEIDTDRNMVKVVVSMFGRMMP